MKQKVNAYTIYVVFLLAVSLLPILAPVLLKISETLPIFQLPAKIIYLVYSFTCHQFAYRSIHAFDYQFAWCARDTGIWLGVLFVALFAKHIKTLAWYWLIPFVLPIALDGGIQTIATMLGVSVIGPTGDPLYISNNFVRFLTGAIFGIGISLWISPFMYEAFADKAEQLKSQAMAWRKNKFVVAGIGSIIVVYILLVGLWAITSPKYKPTDFLDSAVKTPVMDFYIRRANGPCPADPKDLLKLDCLISTSQI